MGPFANGFGSESKCTINNEQILGLIDLHVQNLGIFTCDLNGGSRSEKGSFPPPAHPGISRSLKRTPERNPLFFGLTIAPPTAASEVS